MSEKKITHLLIDTSYLFKFGTDFGHSDFMKLLRCSTVDGTLKIYIPHIVWEERRTQLLEEAYSYSRKLRSSFDALYAQMGTNIVLRGIPPPALSLWDEDLMDIWSKQIMRDFARENKIEIVPLASDHADRAWDRFFKIDPPFRREEERSNRRKDIPDSWILEAAIDIAKNHKGLFALVPDGKLSRALKLAGVTILSDPQQVIDEIDKSAITSDITKALTTADTVSVPLVEKVKEPIPGDKLQIVLAEAREPFKDLEAKILGYVGYIGMPLKGELFDLLSRAGVSVDIAKNVTERLVLAELITDTGNHYLSKNKYATDLASKLVEPEIIKLLGEM